MCRLCIAEGGGVQVYPQDNYTPNGIIIFPNGIIIKKRMSLLWSYGFVFLFCSNPKDWYLIARNLITHPCFCSASEGTSSLCSTVKWETRRSSHNFTIKLELFENKTRWSYLVKLFNFLQNYWINSSVVLLIIIFLSCIAL